MHNNLKTLILMWVGIVFSFPAQAFEEGLFAKIETTKGFILLRLHYQKVPQTVANFVGLVEGTKEWKDPITRKRKKSKFYTGLSFHRVIKDFMIQGGDPMGNGSGGPGYKFADEFHPSLKHDRPGILSMANSGPNTNGSQFFITHVPTPWLDGKHSVFGEVVEGIDVVNAVVKGDLIQTIEIIRQGMLAKSFDASQFEAMQKQKLANLTEKQRKLIPTIHSELDPKRIPQKNQAKAQEVSLELLVIAYKGVQSPLPSIYYGKKEARKVAQQLSDLGRRQGVKFHDLIKKYSDLPQQPRIPSVNLQTPNLLPFLKKAFTLKIGQVSDPIDSPFGYIVFHRVSLKMVLASHILISFQGAKRSNQTRTKEEARRLAQELSLRAKKNEDFAELAKKYSDGPSAPKGGNLGRFSQGQMVPAFDVVVFSLKLGEISDAVETPFGFHVIKRFE